MKDMLKKKENCTNFVPFEIYKTELDHLIKMAKIPAFKNHAWTRAKELDADSSGLFTGIAQDLVKEMKNG